MGGDSSYLRPRAELTWFKPLSLGPLRSSFGLHVETGWIAPQDGTRLFSTQRFFLGGTSNVRGFRSGSITVREADGERPIRFDENGFPLGGDSMLQVNLEYHLIPRGPLRAVLFADAGGVFAGDQPIDPSLMRTSAGAELRVTVPLFPAPLRFIFANNLDPLDDDQFKSIDFSLSASF